MKLFLLPHCKIKETICHLTHLPRTELIYNNKIVPLCSGTPSEKSSALTENTWVRRDIFPVILLAQDQSACPSPPPQSRRSIWIYKRKNLYSQVFNAKNSVDSTLPWSIYLAGKSFPYDTILPVTMPHTLSRMTKAGWPQLCTGFHQRADSSSVCN